MIKLISWNVNGLRAVLQKGFLDFIETHDPDILCLQETKAMREQVELDLPQYEEFWHSAEKKGYSGTAIFSKEKPLQELYGFHPDVHDGSPLLDNAERNGASEGRVISLEFPTYWVVTVYTPNTKGDLSRLPFRHDVWDPLFLKHVKRLEEEKPVIFCGDLNVAHHPIDLARPDDNEGKNGFTAEERAGMTNIVEAGFVDTFRTAYPDTPEKYSWWSYRTRARDRNIGWRIDYVCVSESLKEKVNDAFILSEVLGSDHCPVGVKINV